MLQNKIIEKLLNLEQIQKVQSKYGVYLLREYTQQYYFEDVNVVKRMISKLISDPRCFERDNYEFGHFTASAWIITEDNTKALITHHKKLGLKLQLGGHCDGDSNLLKVAIKEAMEESGIIDLKFSTKIFDIDIHTIPAYRDTSEHEHFDVRFLFTVPNDSEFVVSEESTKLEWISKDYDVSESKLGFKRLFGKWLSLDLNDHEFNKL